MPLRQSTPASEDHAHGNVRLATHHIGLVKYGVLCALHRLTSEVGVLSSRGRWWLCRDDKTSCGTLSEIEKECSVRGHGNTGIGRVEPGISKGERRWTQGR